MNLNKQRYLLPLSVLMISASVYASNQNDPFQIITNPNGPDSISVPRISHTQQTSIHQCAIYITNHLKGRCIWYKNRQDIASSELCPANIDLMPLSKCLIATVQDTILTQEGNKVIQWNILFECASPDGHLTKIYPVDEEATFVMQRTQQDNWALTKITEDARQPGNYFENILHTTDSKEISQGDRATMTRAMFRYMHYNLVGITYKLYMIHGIHIPAWSKEQLEKISQVFPT